MRVTFVRHGESQANSDGRWQGHGDSPLSEHGRGQAARAAERLRATVYTRVVSSDLSRARETARALGVEPVQDRGLREVDVGRWEGMRRAEVLAQFPDEIAGLMRGEDVKIGGAESWGDATRRARAALDRQLSDLSQGDEIAIFSHGGVITSLFLDVVGAGRRRPQPLGHMVNTAISVASFGTDGVMVERYNDANHVPETAPWRRSMFGEKDTLVGFLAVTELSDVEKIARNTKVFEECAAIVSVDETLRESATLLAHKTGISLDRVTEHASFEHVAARHNSRRVIVVCRPETVAAQVDDLAKSASLTARFRPVNEATLSHIARAGSTLLLVDFGSMVGDP